ncbi:MAG: phosphoenolpyruvate--protein phosphotransferase [Sedimentisphaerales bacterium]|nr:phosphoenolpyruvate--protein phosphotransferase [Sedimentisphaerales bacterium]
MEILKGIGVSSGVAICSAVLLDAEEYRIPRRQIAATVVRAEQQRLRQAFSQAAQEVAGLQNAQQELWDSKIKDIFAVHLHFLRDRTLRRQIADLIEQQHYSAEYAVSVVLRDVAKHFSQASDAYISERVNDIYDIEKRLIRHLIGQRREDLAHLSEPVIVVAHDLTPMQTASFDKHYVLGLATDAGGRTSHTAIVARSLSIPAVVALGQVSEKTAGGDTVIVDGHRGLFIINPDEDTINEYRAFEATILEHIHELDELAQQSAITTDGVTIQLLGNIEFPDEADITLKKGGDGIGLYRTEFLYIDADHEPTEEDHYQAYLQVIKIFGNSPITIRTLDLGADKFTQNRRSAREPNPFLGLRSIRYCLRNIAMFKRQIRAILRASAHGNLKLMFPLITNLLELRQAKWLVADAREDLEEEGIHFDENIQIGMMVETPAAALMADEFAHEVDFFSIGTNDLIQYTLAVDRGNEEVASLYSPAHPAVLTLLRQVMQSARRAKIDLSLCGEMASDVDYTALLLGLGFTTLSMAAPMIPEIKRVIRALSMEQCRQIARKAVGFDTDKQIISYLRTEMQNILSDET